MNICETEQMLNSNEEDKAFLPIMGKGGEVVVKGRQGKSGNEGCIRGQRAVAQHARVLVQVQKMSSKNVKKSVPKTSGADLSQSK